MKGILEITKSIFGWQSGHCFRFLDLLTITSSCLTYMFLKNYLCEPNSANYTISRLKYYLALMP